MYLRPLEYFFIVVQVHLSQKKDFMYLFLEKGGEGEKEGDKH